MGNLNSSIKSLPPMINRLAAQSSSIKSELELLEGKNNDYYDFKFCHSRGKNWF
jgi:hypothetical protein